MLVRHDPERRLRWCAKDTACLKKISAELSKVLPQSAACTHLRGNGGLKGTLRRVQRALGQHHYVFRTGVKGHLSTLGLELHPDKTSMGPIARGFDFLGYQHDPTGLRLSHITLQRHQEKLTRLYEQYHRQLRAYRSGWIGRSTILREAKDPAQAYLNPRPSITSHEDITRLLEAYQKRFTAWASGGLPTCEIGYEQL